MQFVTLEPNSCPKEFAAWKKAALGTHQADPFCCLPEWQLAFHDAFSPKRRLLIEEREGNVIAFAEKIFPSQDVVLTPIEPLWFFGCPLLGKEALALYEEFIGYVAKVYAPNFPNVLISGIRPGGTLAKRLLQTLLGQFNFYLHSERLQCSASLSGGTDGYLARRSANHRSKLKKARKRAREAGIYFERVMPDSPEAAAKTYERMLAVELKSWKGIGQCGMAEPGPKEFYDFMLHRLSASRSGRVIFAKHDDSDIGFIFGGLAGKIYRGQQFSYTEEWQAFSVGNLMQMEQISWLCEEGCKRYDMGPLTGPKMEYKAHWTEKKIPICNWMLEKK